MNNYRFTISACSIRKRIEKNSNQTHRSKMNQK